MATNFNRTTRATFRKAPTNDPVVVRPALQPSAPLVQFGKRTVDDKAELDALIAATDNRGPTNDLYERINFLRGGRRTPRRPSSY
jgi:hypothetical protein